MTDFLTSPLLTEHGFRHGFSLRTGGVSAAPYDTANLGRNVGDAPESVATNHRRLAHGVGYELDALRESSQVHGAAVVDADAHGEAEARLLSADALFATRRGLAVGVRTADCVPLLVGDRRSRAVIAIHAGWRGVVAGVVPAAIASLRARVGEGALVVAIGPHIRGPSFEVGEDVAAQIQGVAHGRSVVVGRSAEDKPLVDLTVALRAQLAALGIDAIDDVGGCTLTEAERFFSFRRDAQRSGRHLSVIVAG